MPDEITIHLRFGVDTPLGQFQDTLVFTEADWARRDDRAVTQAKQALADTWVTFRSAQLAEEAALRTVEGRQAKIVEIDRKVSDLLAVKAGLS